jgi:hypothetical protein
MTVTRSGFKLVDFPAGIGGAAPETVTQRSAQLSAIGPDPGD